jgi:peptide deformylase
LYIWGDIILKLKDILDEKDKRLKIISEDVVFPLEKQDFKLIDDMIEYLTNSQIEEVAEKLSLRPGMGMSAIQLGISKRYFVVVEEVYENEIQTFKNYIIVNPNIISYSEELIYADMGEGCLSVNREVIGIVPRHARVTVEGYDINGKKITIRAREEVSIAFQHEIDHLNGILFFEHIDKKDPYKGENTMRAI